MLATLPNSVFAERGVSRIAKPFLKWAGGKGQLLRQIMQYLPPELEGGSIQKYAEPFIGGGAVFFYITQRYEFEECYISDVNPDLILVYKVVQQNVDELIAVLSILQEEYSSLDSGKRKDYYYQVRWKFNQGLQAEHFYDFNALKTSSVERAAQIIFLNRTCFNGLFRVNSQGQFNVPVGRYKNPMICDRENLKASAQVLQRTQIHYGDFEQSDEFIEEDCLVYFDPPYRPLNKTSNFTAYTGGSFDDGEQVRLSQFFQHLDHKGAKLMLSNSDPKNEDINDHFFDEVYQNYRILKIKASRNINSKVANRGKINEILVLNY